jgi:hypothetical protein
MTRDEAIKELREICEEIGCSGLSKDCLTKPHLCSIIRKMIWASTGVNKTTKGLQAETRNPLISW